MASTPKSGLRILIGAGSFADASAALRIVEHLPEAFCASLGGVFVEETYALATCQLPERHVVTKGGQKMLAPDRTKFRTILQAEARAFQQSLKLKFDQGTGKTPFTQQEGELVSTSLRVAESWDVLVIGYRPFHRMQGNIIVLQSAGAQREQLDLASYSLSRALRTDRLWFTVGGDAKDEDRPFPSDTIQFDTFDQVLYALARTNAPVVLVDITDRLFDGHADLARVLDAARCPLIVFGAGQQTAWLAHTVQIPPTAGGDGSVERK